MPRQPNTPTKTPPTKIAILSIHGIGTQESDFADTLHKRMEKLLSKQGFTPMFESVFWADEIDGLEDELLRKAEALGANNNLLRRLVVGTLADALAYRQHRPISTEVLGRVADGLDRLYAPWRRRAESRVPGIGRDDGANTGAHLPQEALGTPLFILAHSLGGLIIADYLQAIVGRDTRYGLNELRGLITFGCNIPIFAIGGAFLAPPMRNASWVNLWDEDDALGFPLQTLPELSHVQDIRVNVGNLFTWWNGFSHFAYWKDRSFAKEVSKQIVRLLHQRRDAGADTMPDVLVKH